MDFHGHDPMICVMICKFGAMGMVRSMGLYMVYVHALSILTPILSPFYTGSGPLPLEGPMILRVYEFCWVFVDTIMVT